MTEVVIAGIGQAPVAEHWGISLRELSLLSVADAVKDAAGLRPQAVFIANMLAPVMSHQAHLGALIADFIGLKGVEASTIEAAGASGGAALRMGFMAVASGAVDVALVIGIEKSTDLLGSSVEAAYAETTDSDYEAIQGLTPTAQAALLMNRYMYEYQVPHEAFAGFPITAHANAVTNPNAMFRSKVELETYKQAGMVSAPINLFDAAPNGDGSASVVLTRPEILPASFSHPLVRIVGSSLVTAPLALHDRPEPLVFDAARLSVERACRQAGILPEDVDFFELYDAYSIFAALSLEAAGFAPKGQGWKLAQDGCIALDASLPISTFGGLKARGNPGGATGVYQAVEACLQLRGEAGANQVPEARRGLIQCLSGPASSAATHVLEIV
ncbi:MAG: thiolase C-terminal domain-containing protein [Omnitrophica WOR_2 bacterium]